MTPVTRFLRGLFFQPILEAEDRERRIRETDERVCHAERMVANSVNGLAESSARLRQAKEELVNERFVAAISDLSNTLDR